MNEQLCTACLTRLAVFQCLPTDNEDPDEPGGYMKRCDECLTPAQRAEIEKGRLELEYAKLHPRDVVESEGAGNI